MRGRSNRQSVDDQTARTGVFKIYGPHGGHTKSESVQYNTIRKVVDPSKKSQTRPLNSANAPLHKTGSHGGRHTQLRNQQHELKKEASGKEQATGQIKELNDKIAEMQGELLVKDQKLKRVNTMLEAQDIEGAMKLFDLQYDGARPTEESN